MRPTRTKPPFREDLGPLPDNEESPSPQDMLGLKVAAVVSALIILAGVLFATWLHHQ